jgi:hypothetical protein
MMKVVINARFGGFGLSHKATMRYANLSGFTLYPYYDSFTMTCYGVQPGAWDNPESGAPIGYSRVPLETLELDNEGDYKFPSDEDYFSEYSLDRTDPMLVRVVEELGDEANGRHAQLKVVEIPDGVDYFIDEYDGNEHVAERHRTWA